MNRISSKATEQLKKVQSELQQQYDVNSTEALKIAFSLKADETLSADLVEGVKAAALIDVGAIRKSRELVEQGVAILCRLRKKCSERRDLAYNLANGLSLLAKLAPNRTEPLWFLRTSEIRRKARTLYHESAEAHSSSWLCAQALTNIANELLRASRSLEALNAYRQALQHDPRNGLAAAGAAKVLLAYQRFGMGDPDSLSNAVCKYLTMAQENTDSILKLGGAGALQELTWLLKMNVPIRPLPEEAPPNRYEQFVAANDLMLSPDIEGAPHSPKRWDSLVIGSVTEPIPTEFGVPPVFAMFNTIKADFLACRWLAFLAIEGEIPETGVYADTLDYANYGIGASLQQLALRSCMDILDKIAITTTEYLGFPGGKTEVTFATAWHTSPTKSDEKLQWKSHVEKEILAGNYTLVALSELSQDLEKDGFLRQKKDLRRAATHRFVILHEMETDGARDSRFIERIEAASFKRELLTALKTVRAALFYLVQMIRVKEQQKKSNGDLAVPLVVPFHHWIRGELE